MVHQAEAYPSFCSMRWLGIFSTPPPPPLDGMLVHHRVTPRMKITASIYTPQWREAPRVMCLKHNTITLGRAQIQTAGSRVKHSNHEAMLSWNYNKIILESITVCNYQVPWQWTFHAKKLHYKQLICLINIKPLKMISFKRTTFKHFF